MCFMSGPNGKKQRHNNGNGNLKMFQPGQSGNPNGRPKGESLTTIIRRLLDAPDPKHGTAAQALIDMAVKRARRGDFRFFKELIDRRDGKAPETVNVSGDVTFTLAIGEKAIADRVADN